MDDDNDVIRKFPHNARVYFPLEIRLRRNPIVRKTNISLAEEIFRQEFKERIIDFACDTEIERVRQILPQVSKHTLPFDNVTEQLSAEEISNIALSMKHLYLKRDYI